MLAQRGDKCAEVLNVCVYVCARYELMAGLSLIDLPMAAERRMLSS